MKTKKSDSFSFAILFILLLCVGCYYYNESQKRLYKGDVISKELTVSDVKPTRSDYESTDDIEIEFEEYRYKTFKISYLRIEESKAKEILSHLELNDKIIIDADKHYFRKKIKQNPFLGIKPSVLILGVRTSQLEEIPIDDYNFEVVSQNLMTSIISFFGVGIIVLIWIYQYYKNHQKG
ncbi:MAG: hypothetical protein ACSHXF_10880 [Aquaticitalea sp.]